MIQQLQTTIALEQQKANKLKMSMENSKKHQEHQSVSPMRHGQSQVDIMELYKTPRTTTKLLTVQNSTYSPIRPTHEKNKNDHIGDKSPHKNEISPIRNNNPNKINDDKKQTPIKTYMKEAP